MPLSLQQSVFKSSIGNKVVIADVLYSILNLIWKVPVLNKVLFMRDVVCYYCISYVQNTK